VFGVEALAGGGRGVIDIAGGRGMLSLELALTHRVPATLVEPKPLRLNKAYQKRVKKWRRLNSEAAEGQCAKAEGAEEEGAAEEKDEQGEELELDDGGGDSDDARDCETEAAEGARTKDEGEGEDGAAAAEQAEEQGGAAAGGEAAPELEEPVRHIQAEFHGLHGSADDVVAALHSAGTVLGMHPDIPTGHIVDAAVALGRCST
jgi:hypothetical protein